ncbi:MAG: hypothetical protein WCE46_06470 [Methanoregula sp.]
MNDDGIINKAYHRAQSRKRFSYRPNEIFFSSTTFQDFFNLAIASFFFQEISGP